MLELLIIIALLNLATVIILWRGRKVYIYEGNKHETIDVSAPSLQDLRQRVRAFAKPRGKLKPKINDDEAAHALEKDY